MMHTGYCSVPTRCGLFLILWAWLVAGQAQGFGFNERGPSLGEQIDPRPASAPSPATAGTTRQPPPTSDRPTQGFSRKQSYGYEEDLFAEGLMLPTD